MDFGVEADSLDRIRTVVKMLLKAGAIVEGISIEVYNEGIYHTLGPKAAERFARYGKISDNQYESNDEAKLTRFVKLDESLNSPLPYEIGRASCRERVCQYV